MAHSLFSVYGIEVEYPICQKSSLQILPLADVLLRDFAGATTNDVTFGEMGLSNELCLHVIEMKNEVPLPSLAEIARQMHHTVLQAQEKLDVYNATLLPTGMHPFMQPTKETVLWPHDFKEIYQKYDELFSCRTHGFANVQSVHINLPFASEAEFTVLLQAIRFVLPLIPGLAASSPLCEGVLQKTADTRLAYYNHNQQRFQSVAGSIIPEAIFSFADYHQNILQPIAREIAPFNDEGWLEAEWMNSRGAIARFERDAIEIRLMDTQESSKCHLAVVSLIVAVVRWCVEQGPDFLAEIAAFPQKELVALYQKCWQNGGAAVIDNQVYLRLFGLTAPTKLKATELWQHLASVVAKNVVFPEVLAVIFAHGCLAHRIQNALPKSFKHEDVVAVYQRLQQCLLRDEVFQ